MEDLLRIENLHISYRTMEGTVYAVNGVNLSVEKGETLGLVGETGAGKTTTALSILNLLPKPAASVDQGRILFQNRDLLAASKREIRKIRGDRIAMIFQDPMTSLNTSFRIGNQVAEVLRIHRKELGKREIEERTARLLETVGIGRERWDDYPHQLSGGMKQRVMIAMALACSPELLLADEPTTALDVTIQAQVLQLMRHLKEEFGMAMMLITHDLGVVAENCERVAVLYAGEVLETGTAEEIFDGQVRHPYTEGLLGAIPSPDHKISRLSPVAGQTPDPSKLLPGCVFAPRCPHCSKRCLEDKPKERQRGGHRIKCHLFADKAEWRE